MIKNFNCSWKIYCIINTYMLY